MHSYTAHIHSNIRSIGNYPPNTTMWCCTAARSAANQHHKDTDCLVLSLVGMLDKKILTKPLLCIHIQIISTQTFDL